MRRFLIALALLTAYSSTAVSQECVDIAVKTAGGAAFTAVDISGGAVTTGEIAVAPHVEVLLRVDLVDASDGVSNLQFTINELPSAGGTSRKLWGDCSGTNPLTCKILKINVDPRNAAEGKNGTIPLPVNFRRMTITATPTGHGAGDTLSLDILGCS